MYENSVCTLHPAVSVALKKNRLVLFGEIVAVCFGSCRKHINGDFVTICDLMLKCKAHDV